MVIKPRKVNWAEHVTCKGELRNVYRNIASKSKWKMPLERFRCGILKKFPGCGLISTDSERRLVGVSFEQIMILRVP
jgi:hypothetical protein